MPKNYIFTLTFEPTIGLDKKYRLIDKIPQVFTDFIEEDSELFYTIEYHKKADKISNNYFRPHIHGILTTPNILGKVIVRSLIITLKRKYGRILQFSLQEDLEEVTNWKQYCLKDVSKNELEKQRPHQFNVSLKYIRIEDDDYSN